MSTRLGNGTITFGDGTTQSSAALPFGGQAFTSSGTFTIPAGVTSLKIIAVGGGGANGTGGSRGGNGGGSGGVAWSYLNGLTPGNTLNISVGGVNGDSSVSSGTQSITTIIGGGGSNQSGGGASGGNFINQPGRFGQPEIAGGSGTGDPGFMAPAAYYGFGGGGQQGAVFIDW